MWIISRRSNKSKGIPCGLLLINLLPFVVGASDVGDTSICGQYYNWCGLAFKGSVQE